MMMQLQDKRIFYVEDDIKNRVVVKMILEVVGAVVASESWGKLEVVTARLAEFQPDLILLDLMFPRNVSGYDIFEVIHNDPPFAHLPVVAVSASDPSIEVPRTRAKGFAGFISKPITLQQFPDQIAAVLNHESIWHIG
jgi:two-component system, cell cycle response regulator DivK